MKNLKYLLPSLFLFFCYCAKNEPNQQSLELKSEPKSIAQNTKEGKYRSVILADTTYSGSFDITDTQRFQGVMFSQNYGTFYGVYSKPTFFDNKKEYLKSLIFRIINYSGDINIGFVGTEPFVDVIELSETGKKLNMVLFVKGMSDKNEFEYEFTRQDSITPKNVSKFQIFRFLVPLDNGNKSRYHNEVFDSEFYYRNGLDEMPPRTARPGHYNYKFSEGEQEKSLTFIEKVKDIYMALDGNCYSSKMHVMSNN